ncbi:MAG: class I SAM-dependent methyltransferase [Planctomycetales bacterium]|nr:class I SAM-dependent methyltransferase [Planctomycetales bacterium]
MTDPTEAHNRRVWDAMVRKRDRFTTPAKDSEFANPLATVDGLGWLGGDIRGQQVLCLAAGGGRQSALYAAAGGRVTVVDISPAMLELDRAVAEQRQLEVRTVEASMQRLPFADSSFDLVIHPVSTCYVESIVDVFREVARVCRPGGLYISQHKQPTSLQAGLAASARGYELIEPYYRSGPLPAAAEPSRLREAGALEFVHRWEDMIGGMCRSGFVIEDLVEPFHAEPQSAPGSFGHRCTYIAPYVRIKARRRGEQRSVPSLVLR